MEDVENLHFFRLWQKDEFIKLIIVPLEDQWPCQLPPVSANSTIILAVQA